MSLPRYTWQMHTCTQINILHQKYCSPLANSSRPQPGRQLPAAHLAGGGYAALLPPQHQGLPCPPPRTPQALGWLHRDLGTSSQPCRNVLLSLKVLLQRKINFSTHVAISASVARAVNLVVSFRIFIFKERINNNCFLPNEDKRHGRLELSCISCIWS